MKKYQKLYNPKHTKARRRYLRNNMTKAEVKLWSLLKGKKFLGYKFRRQHGIENYIVDFYCPELKLAVEVDGDSHFYESGKLHDDKRDQFLKSLGIAVLRFTNPEIFDNLDGVLKALENEIKTLESQNM